MSVSTKNKMIARHAQKAFAGNLSVHAYIHDTINLSLDILDCVDCPTKGVTSYSTIGLSDYRMLKNGKQFPARLEIAGACAREKDLFPNILAAASFNIMRTHKLYYPGAVMRGYVREYYHSTKLPHLYFTAPFLWEAKLTPLEFEGRNVNWLLALPISEAERKYLKKHGDEPLEDLFQVHQIDLFDLDRPSVI